MALRSKALSDRSPERSIRRVPGSIRRFGPASGTSLTQTAIFMHPPCRSAFVMRFRTLTVRPRRGHLPVNSGGRFSKKAAIPSV